jgi:hypothetical protein
VENVDELWYILTITMIGLTTVSGFVSYMGWNEFEQLFLSERTLQMLIAVSIPVCVFRIAFLGLCQLDEAVGHVAGKYPLQK